MLLRETHTLGGSFRKSRGESCPLIWGRGRPGLSRHHWTEATCGALGPSPKAQRHWTLAHTLPIKGGPSSGRWGQLREIDKLDFP